MDLIDDDLIKVQFEKKLIMIDVDNIIPNKYNPREEKAFKNLDDIISSIEDMGGILVPILVYEKSSNKYVIIDGERRWRASKYLSKKEEKYKFIPANIIKEPLDKIENFLIMFNVHMERTEWSTGATAIAIGELKKINPNITDKELSKRIHVSEGRIKDAYIFLMAPKDLQEKILKGDSKIEEYHVIYLIRNLKSIEKIYPELYIDPNFNEILYKILKKVEAGIVTNYRDFSSLGSILRTCNKYDEEKLFKSEFKKIVDDLYYTPKESIKYVNLFIEDTYDVEFKTMEENLIKSCNSMLKRIDDLDKIKIQDLELLDATIERLKILKIKLDDVLIKLQV